MTDLFTPLGDLPADPVTRAAVVVACDARGRVLLQLRDDLPGVAAPGQWCVFGGGVEGDEGLAQAAAREFAEETGVALSPELFQPLAAVAGRAHKGAVLYAFRCTVPVEVAQVKLAEGAGFGFFTARQVAALDLVPTTRAVLTHAGLMP